MQRKAFSWSAISCPVDKSRNRPADVYRSAWWNFQSIVRILNGLYKSDSLRLDFN